RRVSWIEQIPTPSSGSCRSRTSRRRSLLRRNQAIPVAVRLPDERRMLRIAFELVAQAEDEVVDRPGERRVRVAPDEVQQLVARDDVAGALGEAPENLELPVGQLNGLRPAPGAQPPEIDDRVPERQLIDPRFRPAEDRVYPRQQLVERERFGD